VRARVRATLRRLLVAVLPWLLRVVPSRPGVLVSTGQDDEDNALVMAARLAGAGAGPVVLSCGAPAVAAPRLASVARALDEDVSRVVVVPRLSRAELVAFVCSRLVLYTHGMYDSPVVRRRRVHVNLWHGSGPKWIDHGLFAQQMGARHLVASARTWGRETARALRMPADTSLLTGNPRQDLLTRPPARDVLRALGLDPDRPFVVWMPTFRAQAVPGRGVAVQGVSVTSALADDPVLRGLAERAAAEGVQLVVKTHAYDADDWGVLPVTRLTSDDLWRAGLSIYQFLGLAGGLVSDYSSVWVDYLPLDRPIALYCPDLDAYVADRGLNAPTMDVAAAELVVRDGHDVAAFVARVRDGVATTAVHDLVRERLDYAIADDRSIVLRDELLALLR
jgi:hypothetical protein